MWMPRAKGPDCGTKCSRGPRSGQLLADAHDLRARAGGRAAGRRRGWSAAPGGESSAIGVRPAPVLPVMPTAKRSGSAMPSFSSGTAASSMAVAKQPGWLTCGRSVAARCSGTAQTNSGSSCGAPCGVLVDGLVGGRGREAEIRGHVDDGEIGPALPGPGDERAEQLRAGAVRRGREQRQRPGREDAP